MVTIGATLLLAPLLWDHYLASLLLPAAFLAQRGRTWGLALPLLALAAPPLLPLLAIAGHARAVPGARPTDPRCRRTRTCGVDPVAATRPGVRHLMAQPSRRRDAARPVSSRRRPASGSNRPRRPAEARRGERPGGQLHDAGRRP